MRISVIIPCYNAGDYLLQAIASIKRQKTDFPLKLEIIVVDDESEDGSAKRAAAAGASVLEQKHSGPAAARNFGWRESVGEYLLFLDADDVLSDDAIQSFSDALQRDRGAEICLGMAKEFISPEITANEAHRLSKKPDAFKGFFSGACFGSREAFECVGAFDEGMGSGETVEWMARLRDSEVKVTQIGSITVYRRVHLRNTGQLRYREEMRDYAKILRRRLQARRMGNQS